MKRSTSGLIVFVLALAACSRTEMPRPPAPGPIAAEPGGLAGYQHGNGRSKFAVGSDPREVAELGFLKVVGAEGTFAVDAHNGLAVAIPNASSAKTKSGRWYTRDFAQHNQAVMDYFTAAGIPKDQVGGVHATMSMSAGAAGAQTPRPQPAVGGYQSIIERKFGEISVVDSVAWARMNDAGEVLTEWVYWPAIPAKTIEDARRMRAMLLNDAEKSAYLAKLPANLPPGNVVVRHSSATSATAFEAFASYDVAERRLSLRALTGGQATSSHATLIVRHFELSGEERKLPQEKAQFAADYPTAVRKKDK